MKRILCAAAAIAISTVAFIPIHAMAQVRVNIIVPSAPPPIIVESAPVPRSGYVWAPGYWNWNGSKHVWAAGHWERARAGYQYVRPEWRQDGDQWRLEQGGWKQAKKDKKYKKHQDHDQGHDDRRGYHCPPGQAKKGNC